MNWNWRIKIMLIQIFKNLRERKREKNPKQNFYCWHNGKLAWIPSPPSKSNMKNTQR